MTNSSFKLDRAWTTLSTMPIVNCGSRLADKARKGSTATDGRLVANSAGPVALGEGGDGRTGVSGCCCRREAIKSCVSLCGSMS